MLKVVLIKLIFDLVLRILNR